MNMKFALKSAAGLAAISLVLGACASAPDPSPRLLAAESSLMQAKAKPATMEAGRASIEKAETTLRQARDFYMDRKNDDYTHALRMGEGYVALAETRGSQLAADRKIAALNVDREQVVSQSRARQLNASEAATATARAATATAEAATIRAEAATVRAEDATTAAEARTAAALADLADYEQKQTELGMTLILRDLQFSSGSAVLIPGAQGRLAPLAAFMAKQPEARIQIAGHTDSQGSDSANMDLSARRAQSVGAYLSSTGISMTRISAVGLGEGVPVATNDTAAGRAINRRVEVTILD
jgi:outer membrane protein OmpA-like peptidoglycan-associated protein